MSYTLATLSATAALFVAMVGLVLFARRREGKRIARGGTPKARGNVDGAVFSLLALMIAFSFYGAIGRYDEHRKLVGAEVNTLDGVYHILQLVPPPASEALKAKMRDYVQSRIDVYNSGVDPKSEAATRSRVLREQIWSGAVAACAGGACAAPVVTLLMNGLDRMLQFPVDQAVMRRMHPPTVVFVLLFMLALACAYFIGLELATATQSSLLYILTYPVALSVIIWIILDLELPRAGVVRLDAFTELLVQLRGEMTTP